MSHDTFIHYNYKECYTTWQLLYLYNKSQIPLRYTARDQLASRSATRWRAGLGAGSRAASELDEDLRVHVVCVPQAKFHYAVPLATSSRAGLRPAGELVRELLAS